MCVCCMCVHTMGIFSGRSSVTQQCNIETMQHCNSVIEIKKTKSMKTYAPTSEDSLYASPKFSSVFFKANITKP